VKLQSPSLFWRTFLLIVGLAVTSLAVWVPTVRVVERVPRAHQLAEQVVSIIHATRNALVFSDPERRRELLDAMVADENLRVVPLEATDRVQDMQDTPIIRLVRQEVRQRLGAGTRLASEVNSVRGFWVSFSIDEDAYWVFMDRDLLRRDIGSGWIAWAALATVLSILVAIAVTRVVNRPLAGLSRAAADLGAGRAPAPLPDAGPVEIRTVNRNFNRMVADLEKLAQDRAVLLAGVSHDLRTPMARLRLELEMSELPPASREAMVGDLEQMDLIVRQFLDYALPAPERGAEPIDLSALLRESLSRNRLLAPGAEQDASDARGTHALKADIEEGVVVEGYRPELARVLDNLLGNASRYGRDAAGHLELEVSLHAAQDAAELAIADQGSGIPPGEIARLVRPFERGDSSRSGVSGAGLGLAIVERAARLNRAQVEYEANTPNGLRVKIRIPLSGQAIAAPREAASAL
jgi:two-component system osmolarity sensor histidine kinase EnvZ